MEKEMLQDVVHPPEQLLIGSTLSPISAQILGFGDDGELFPTILRTSGASPSSPGLDLASATGADKLCSLYDATHGAGTDPFSPFGSMDRSSISPLLDMPLRDYEANIEPIVNNCPSHLAMFPLVPSYFGEQKQDQFDQIILQEMSPGGYSIYSPDSEVSLPVGSMTPVYEGRLPPAYMGLETSETSAQCPFLDMRSSTLYSGMGTSACGSKSQGFFIGGMTTGMEAPMSPQELVEYQRADSSETGFYVPGSIQPIYSSGNLQVMGDNQHHLMRGGGSSSSATTPLSTTDIPTPDDPNFKVGRLSIEERKEKIHRYMKKKNERNFSKKIKYACRKTLADSRPRIRGRFAKNDELGETMRPSSSNQEYDDDEEVMVKEEDDLLDSSDILAHISGVNSFKYNYALESWI